MDNDLLLAVGGLSIGFFAGLMAFYFLVRNRVEVPREKCDRLVLDLPIFGRIKTRFQIEYRGVFLDDWGSLRYKVEVLGRLLDPEFIFHYGRQYGIRYVGLEGDRKDKTWSRGRLAYSALSRCESGGYNIFLNPSLDLADVARRLSLELGEVIYPSEVQPFLFLHEIGHTRKAGNECYFTALVNHSMSGGKRSVKRRSELVNLKRKIEAYADQFALNELKKWRSEQKKNVAKF